MDYHLILIGWQNIPNEIKIFLLAMIPVGELRAALPMAIKIYHLNIWSAWFWSVLGNAIMGGLVILFLEPLVKISINKINFLKLFWEKYLHRLENRNRAKFEKWGAIILITFVAMPLPMTGAFSGAIVASIFQIPYLKAIPLLSLGCAIAGIIVLSLTLIFS